VEPNSIVVLTFSTPADIGTRTGKSAESTGTPGQHLAQNLRALFAAGESESAKLSDVLAKLHETSLTQLIKDHESGGLDEKVRKAALA
jgi:hypothetical protein